MKCDHIRTRAQGDTPFFPNMLNNGKVEVCLKEDVDAAIAELKEENLNLKAKNIKLQSFYDLHGNVDNYIDKLKAENAELKAKLENVQASMYADVVDANMENRRLRRALYKACAKWAISKFELLDYTEQDEPGKWLEMRQKCLKKAEEYK